jgi:hypothetical protein
MYGVSGEVDKIRIFWFGKCKNASKMCRMILVMRKEMSAKPISQRRLWSTPRPHMTFSQITLKMLHPLQSPKFRTLDKLLVARRSSSLRSMRTKRYYHSELHIKFLLESYVWSPQRQLHCEKLLPSLFIRRSAAALHVKTRLTNQACRDTWLEPCYPVKEQRWVLHFRCT